MSVTLKDVAERAGVSRGTVDRVLYDRGIVNNETKEKVLNALKELDYSPNVSARALVKSNRQAKIGVIIPDHPGFFHDEVLRGISEGIKECNSVGIRVILQECDANDPDQYISTIDSMLSEGVRAFALSGQNTQPLITRINELAEKDIPVITINSDIPGSRRAAFVGEDSYRSGRIAGQMMAKMVPSAGTVLIIGGRSEYDAHVGRVQGFIDSLEEYSRFDISSEIVYTYEDYEKTYQFVLHALHEQKLLRGVYLASPAVSAYVDAKTNYALESGRSLPLVTICHDIPPQTLEYLREGSVDLTIEQNIYRQGFKPLQMLKDHLISDQPVLSEEVRSFFNIISSECV